MYTSYDTNVYILNTTARDTFFKRISTGTYGAVVYEGCIANDTNWVRRRRAYSYKYAFFGFNQFENILRIKRKTKNDISLRKLGVSLVFVTFGCVREVCSKALRSIIFHID